MSETKSKGTIMGEKIRAAHQAQFCEAQIEVGKYTLRPFHEGSVFLENGEGEGMQIYPQEFERVLHEYWQKYF